MNYCKRTVVLLFSSIISFTSYAQYSEDDGGIESPNGYLRYVEVGAGATYPTMYDEAMSPIVYSGFGAMPIIGYTKVSQGTLSDVVITASSMNISHDKGELGKVKMKLQRAAIDYRFMFDIPVEMRGVDFKAGAILSAMFNYKEAPHLLDASTVYDYASSIGLTGRALKEFVFRQKTCFLTWDLSIPFFAHLSRPYYLNRKENLDPDNKAVKDFFDNAATGSFGKFFRINSKLGLWYRLENGNAIKLGYQWDYYRMKTINKVYFADHSLYLSFMFNF